MKEIYFTTQYLVETPLSQLYTNTINNFDTPRQQDSGRVQVVKKIFVPAQQAGAVGVRATTRSSAKQYDTRIFFDEGIVYLNDEGEQTNGFTFQSSDGQEFTIEPVSYNNDDARVSCSCLDFYYRFAVWNHSDGSLFGNPPPPYVKKTDQGPVNPNKVPGLCKHLIALVSELRNENFLR